MWQREKRLHPPKLDGRRDASVRERMGQAIDIGIAPDGAALLTRDVGTQEVYSLTVKWL